MIKLSWFTAYVLLLLLLFVVVNLVVFGQTMREFIYEKLFEAREFLCGICPAFIKR